MTQFEILLRRTAKELTTISDYSVGRNSKGRKMYDAISIYEALAVSNFENYRPEIEDRVFDAIYDTLEKHGRLKSI